MGQAVSEVGEIAEMKNVLGDMRVPIKHRMIPPMMLIEHII